MNTTDLDNLDRLEKATADRLARLATLPVDTSRLAERLRQQIPMQEASLSSKRLWLRPMRIAASILLVIGTIVAIAVFSSSGPALASPDALAHVHEKMLADPSHSMRKVTSIDAAAAAISEQWPQRPPLPEMPQHQVMACCVHEVGHKKMACIALLVNEVPVTLAVADSADIKTPQGATLVRDGVTYHVQSAHGVNMVMNERSGRWVCLMGRLSVDQLIEMATKLRL